MKFMVGLPQNDDEFVNYIIKNSEHIYEAYFSWGDFPNGRSNQIRANDYLSWELMDIQRAALKKLADAK